MSKRALMWSGAVTLTVLMSNHALACGHAHQSYAKGTTECFSHHLFQCEDFGAWHKLPGTCGADTPPPATELTTPAYKAPAPEQGKTPPTPQKPTSSST